MTIYEWIKSSIKCDTVLKLTFKRYRPQQQRKATSDNISGDTLPPIEGYTPSVLETHAQEASDASISYAPLSLIIHPKKP